MNNNLKKLEFDKILNAISNYCKTYIGKKYVFDVCAGEVDFSIKD